MPTNKHTNMHTIDKGSLKHAYKTRRASSSTYRIESLCGHSVLSPYPYHASVTTKLDFTCPKCHQVALGTLVTAKE